MILPWGEKFNEIPWGGSIKILLMCLIAYSGLIDPSSAVCFSAELANPIRALLNLSFWPYSDFINIQL